MTGQRIITVPVLSSWTIFVWGLVCLNPYSHLFDKNVMPYSPMAELMREAVWGAMFAGLGFAGLLFAYFERRHITSRLMFGVFAAFSVLYFIGDYSQPGGYIFSAWALANLLIQGEGVWKTQE